MRISHRHKYIMLSPQKTAGNSIYYSIADSVDIAHVDETTPNLEEHHYYQHVVLSKLKTYLIKDGLNWQDYFKFCFIRNPWDRYLSWYCFMQKFLSDYVVAGPIARFFGGHIPLGDLSFKDFIKRTNAYMTESIQGVEEHNQYPLQYYYLDEGKQIDYVGKVENIDEDMIAVCQSIGIDHKSLEVHNKTEHGHYRDYYDTESMKIVHRLENDCIERFEYTF